MCWFLFIYFVCLLTINDNVLCWILVSPILRVHQRCRWPNFISFTGNRVCRGIECIPKVDFLRLFSVVFTLHSTTHIYWVPSPTAESTGEHWQQVMDLQPSSKGNMSVTTSFFVTALIAYFTFRIFFKHICYHIRLELLELFWS